MTRLTFAAGALSGTAVTAVLVLPLAVLGPDTHPDNDPPAASTPPASCSRIECKVLPSEQSLRLERRLESRGYVCTGKAHLSDSVIVDLLAGARVLPFDRALHVGQRGTGWLRSYCSQP